MAFFDFDELAQGFIYPADGTARYDVAFRLVCFRPFVGEVLTGVISSADKDGLRVSMNFFDDVVIPGHFLQSPSEYRAEENLWVWKYENEDEDEDEDADPDAESVFAFNVGEPIRFRVRSINFTQVHSTLSGRQALTTSTHLESAAGSVKPENDDIPPPPTSVRRRSVPRRRHLLRSCLTHFIPTAQDEEFRAHLFCIGAARFPHRASAEPCEFSSGRAWAPEASSAQLWSCCAV
eukprot:scaffold1726_cov260-Pinguiococcus_pyrenoidosus.AAC.9